MYCIQYYMLHSYCFCITYFYLISCCTVWLMLFSSAHLLREWLIFYQMFAISDVVAMGWVNEIRTDVGSCFSNGLHALISCVSIGETLSQSDSSLLPSILSIRIRWCSRHFCSFCQQTAAHTDGSVFFLLFFVFDLHSSRFCNVLRVDVAISLHPSTEKLFQCKRNTFVM